MAMPLPAPAAVPVRIEQYDTNTVSVTVSNSSSTGDSGNGDDDVDVNHGDGVVDEAMQDHNDPGAGGPAPVPTPLPDPVVVEVDTVADESEYRCRLRRRHRHRRRRSRRCFPFSFEMKNSDINLPTAMFSILSMVLLCMAMAEKHWFSIDGGSCRNLVTNLPVDSLSISSFFYIGVFEKTFEQQTETVQPSVTSTIYPRDVIQKTYLYVGGMHDVLMNCVTPRMVHMLKALIVLCCFGLVFDFLAFLLELMASSWKSFIALRRNAVFSIATVLVCVAVHGLSYSFSERLRRLQQSTTPPGRDYAPVSISFGAGFYLVAAAGGAAVLATATTLLRPTTPRPLGDNDYDRVDIGRQFAPDTTDTAALICDEPPAYTP